jgi:hypothetical protein
MWDVERRALAKRHFGNPLRLQVAEWVLSRHREAPFIQQEAQDGVRAVTRSASAVPAVLREFAHTGMLLRVSEENGRVYYSFLDHPLWSAYANCLAALGEVPIAQRDRAER